MKSLKEIKAMSNKDYINYMVENSNFFHNADELVGNIEGINYYTYFTDDDMIKFMLLNHEEKLKRFNIKSMEDIYNLSEQKRSDIADYLYDEDCEMIANYFMIKQKENILQQLKQGGYERG